MERAVTAATEAGLARTRGWQALIHYRSDGSGWRSPIDDPRFFLSPQGKDDPAAELEATVRALYAPPAGGERAAACRFPARRAWIAARLRPQGIELPAVHCGELEKALARVAPHSAALVFPVGHMNDPASMFGHTLLRIDSTHHSALLSYAVNYAAQIDPSDNGISYAFKGIFGGYGGHYALLPYYDMVQSYAHMDQRDMWEYPLALTEEEVRRLFLHIWELRGVASDYYFFDENCASNLLFLLEAARPTLHLTTFHRPWVTPRDTIEVMADAGLLGTPTYRPAQATRIRHLAARLSPAAREQAIHLAEEGADRDAPLPDGEEGARLLELATELLQMHSQRGEVSKAAYQPRFLSLLTARSRLPHASAAPPSPPPSPERGHPGQRFTVTGGAGREGPFVELGYRPAYHDLLDPLIGYHPGAMIAFSNLAIREAGDGLHLQRWDLIHIRSLAPRDLLFRPISWSLQVGFARRDMDDGREGLAFTLNPGGGFAAHGRAGLFYLMVETEASLSRRLAGGYTAGLGGGGGWLAHPTTNWTFLVEGRGLVFPLGDHDQRATLRLGQSYRISRHHALTAEVEARTSDGGSHTELRFGWRRYF